MTNEAVKRRVGARREQILDVALRLFATHGMSNVTTRQIAKAVGISQPSLYAHFQTADEIGDELCVRSFAALFARFTDVMVQPCTPVELLKRLGKAYISFGLEQPDVYRIAFVLEDSKYHGPVTQQPIEPGHAAGFHCFDALRSAVAGILGRDDEVAGITAQSVWASVHGLVALLLARPNFPWADRDRLIDLHLDRLAASLVNMTDEESPPQ